MSFSAARVLSTRTEDVGNDGSTGVFFVTLLAHAKSLSTGSEHKCQQRRQCYVTFTLVRWLIPWSHGDRRPNGTHKTIPLGRMSDFYWTISAIHPKLGQIFHNWIWISVHCHKFTTIFMTFDTTVFCTVPLLLLFELMKHCMCELWWSRGEAEDCGTRIKGSRLCLRFGFGNKSTLDKEKDLVGFLNSHENTKTLCLCAGILNIKFHDYFDCSDAALECLNKTERQAVPCFMRHFRRKGEWRNSLDHNWRAFLGTSVHHSTV